MKKSLILTSVFFVCVSTNAQSQTEKGRQLYDLALSYQRQKDTLKAIEYYEASIKEGFELSKPILAFIYDVRHEYAKAYPLFLSYFNYIKTNIKTNGISKDIMHVFVSSQYKIGEYRLYGYGTDKDVKGSIQFLEDAAKNNFGMAYINLATAYKEIGDTIKAYNTAITANDKYHNDMTMAILAQYYLHGIGCKKNYEKAFELLSPSAENGYFLAQLTLGDLFYTEDFSRHSYEQAFKWYSRLAETTNSQIKGTALRKLSKYYRFVKKDINKAEELLKEASKYGDEDAKSLLDLIGNNN